MNVELKDVRGVSISRPQDVSAFHLIIWVFAVTFELDETQRRRIKAMYGQSSEVIDPVTPTILEFQKIMEYIRDKNKKCVVKVVVDQKLSKKIIKASKKETKIIEVYLINPQALPEASFLPKEQQKYSEIVRREFRGMQAQIPTVQSEILIHSKKLKGYLKDINSAIERAEREVQAFTKSFRTFENSHCLAGDFENISRYRFRLIACINLKTSDFPNSLKAFKNFVYTALPWLNSHLQAMGQNGLAPHSLITSLCRYEAVAFNFMQAEESKAEQERIEKKNKEQEKREREPAAGSIANKPGSYREDSPPPRSSPLQEQYDACFHEVVSIYQEEGLFYHLLNSHLKLMGERDAAWKQLALPFAHLHRAIKQLYRKGLTADPQFYTRPFTVFRGGRARSSELKRYQQAVAAGGSFVEFFGFLSTSLSAKIVADKFVVAGSLRDGRAQGDGVDKEVVFRITINPCTAILQDKYESLVNGFYKLTARQAHGDVEQEVLFNAMNVFRVKNVKQETMASLFSKAELEEVARKEQEERKLATFKYLEKQKRSAFYERKVTVVDLEFGSFYEALLAQNQFDLSPKERAGKENYVHCFNRIRRLDKFDQGDACELTNDPQESYNYFQSKVGESEQNLYLSSRTDNKNYFARLSAICQKLGKTKEALTYSRIAIECYKQLEYVHLNQTYNLHYERLFDMQMRSIQILRESSNFTVADKQLREQLEMIRSKKFNEPKAKLRESQVYINQAINFYSMGKLEECINRFVKCEHQLKKTIASFSFAEEPISCYIQGFLAQLICPHPVLNRRFFCYSSFGEELQRLRREQRQQELAQRHGRREELEQTSKLATDLLAIANAAVKDRKTLFKSRKKYTEFISNFSQQFTLSAISLQSNDGSKPETEKGKVEHKIKLCIFKITGLQQGNEEYNNAMNNLNELIEQWNVIDRNLLDTEAEQTTSIWDFIKKFKQKERERKIKHFQEQKSHILNQNRHLLIQFYLKCAEEIDNSIQELKFEGYLESAANILKLRKEKADFLYQCSDREKALAQIQKIIKSIGKDDENHYCQQASALLTKAKIHLEMRDLRDAIDTLDEALKFFGKTAPEGQDQKLDVSEITQNGYIVGEQEAGQATQEKQSHQQQLNHNNQYLQTRLLKLRCLLMWIQQRKISENGNSHKIDPSRMDSPPWLQQHSNIHMAFVQVQIGQLQTILKARSKQQEDDMQPLKCDLLQILFYFTINLPFSQPNTKAAFKFLQECLQLRSHLGDGDFKNSLVCCQFIFRHSQRVQLLKAFLEMGFQKDLCAPKMDIRNCNFLWKIQKALYLIERQLQKGKAETYMTYLAEALNLLQQEIAKKSDQVLEKQLSLLKQIMKYESGQVHHKLILKLEQENGGSEIENDLEELNQLPCKS